jgi:hypothetical protein
MKTSETTIIGELYTHKLLWRCCLRQVEEAEKAAEESYGSFYFEITAMLMAYMTFESYLNFLGDRLAPDIWENERDFFNKKPYKGIEGKLKKILEIIKCTELKKGAKPYQTIIKLRHLRDYLSHGKPDKYTKTIMHRKGEAPNLFHSNLDRIAPLGAMKSSIEDVEAFINWLHEKAKKVGDEFWLDRSALDGIIESSFGDTRTIKNLTQG